MNLAPFLNTGAKVVMEGMIPLKYSLNNGIRMRPVEIGLEMHFLAVGF